MRLTSKVWLPFVRSWAADRMNKAGPFMLIVLLAACAQVKAPEGGPRDGDGPVLLAAVPPEGSTGFHSDRIVLEFNERIQLIRPTENVMVSPPPGAAPRVTLVGGRSVLIELKTPLQPDRTYTFNLGDAIADLSEGNPAQGLTYVVSTGDHLDSLRLEGRVVDAATDDPIAGVLVLLQNMGDTGDVRSRPPDHFTRSGTDGRFVLSNLPQGPQRIHALRDRNGNYRYDLPNEEIAFLDAPVAAGDTAHLQLRLFTAPSAKQFISMATVLPEWGWQLNLARSASHLQLLPLDRGPGMLQWWPEWNASRDTVVLWPTDTTMLRGQRFAVQVDGALLDTLTYRTSAPMPYYLSVVQGEDMQGTPWLRSSRPLHGLDTSKVKWTKDKAPVPFTWHMDSVDHRLIHLSAQAGLAGSHLELLPGALLGSVGGTNDTVRLQPGAEDAKTLGRLTLKLEADSGSTWQGPFLLQLRSAAGKLVREAPVAALPATIAWERLPPGTMSLRLIEDRDRNGLWTTGHFEPHRQPERVLNSSEPVMVRSGWTLERLWKLPIGTR